MNYTVCDMCGIIKLCGDLVEEINKNNEDWEMCYGVDSHDFCLPCWKKIEDFVLTNKETK